MIKVDLSTAIFIYMFFNVVVVLVYWLCSGYRKKQVKLKTDSDYIWKCDICANVYVDSKDGDFSTCPQCGSVLKRIK